MSATGVLICRLGWLWELVRRVDANPPMTSTRRTAPGVTDAGSWSVPTSH